MSDDSNSWPHLNFDIVRDKRDDQIAARLISFRKDEKFDE